MDIQEWRIKEFECLRHEMHARIKFLHQTINLAIIFWLILLIAVFYLVSRGIPRELLITLLVIAPIIFDLLCFNYQSNQNSLESIAKYIHEAVRPRVAEAGGQEILEWEKYFALLKIPFKFESSFKIFPFVLPSIIPFVLLSMKVPLNFFQYAIIVVDIIFLIFMLENFRYKLRRVK
jgi:hypothetical protein